MDTQLAVSLLNNPPPLLLDELVLSVDSVHDVARRHSVPEDVIDSLMVHPVFTKHLLAAKSYHEKTGEFHRTLARHKFNEALDNAHIKALDPRTSPKDAIAWVDSLSAIGGIKQGANAEVAAGAGFVFNIHMPGGSTVKVEAKNEPSVIEGEIVDTTTELPVVSITSDDYEFVE